MASSQVIHPSGGVKNPLLNKYPSTVANRDMIFQNVVLSVTSIDTISLASNWMYEVIHDYITSTHETSPVGKIKDLGMINRWFPILLVLVSFDNNLVLEFWSQRTFVRVKVLNSEVSIVQSLCEALLGKRTSQRSL